MVTTLLVTAACFLAATAIAMAAGLLLRDLASPPVDPDSPESHFVYKRPDPERGWMNETFHALLEESGTDLETPAALMIIIGGALVGGLGPYLLGESLIGAIAGVVCGATLPICWWAFQGWWRCGEMKTHLAESLQMVADSVRAGHTLEQAAELVAKDIKGPLGSEFEQCARQLKLGQTPTAVMSRMSRRIPLPEFRMFATAVIVHTRTGGALATLTERMASASRHRQEFQGHLSAVTAGSRLSAIGLVVGVIVAAVVLTLIEPDYMRKFVNTDVGPYLVLTAVGLQAAGALWVWQILKVNY